MMYTSWWPIHMTTWMEHSKDKSNVHTHKTNSSKFVIDENHMHWRKTKIIVIVTRPMQPNSNKEEKKRQRQLRHRHPRLAPQHHALHQQPRPLQQCHPHQAKHHHSHPWRDRRDPSQGPLRRSWSAWQPCEILFHVATRPPSCTKVALPQAPYWPSFP